MSKKALIIVDVQNDFCPGGALAVPDGHLIVPIINDLQANGKFDVIVATQDWHPKNHGSFASTHPGKSPGDIVRLGTLPQILWPDHCVQFTPGAEFVSTLNTDKIEKIVQKGTDTEIDSYSGLNDNGHQTSTGLGEFLKEKGVTDVHIAGLATDYCVKFTALDSAAFGFKTSVVVGACRGVNLIPSDVDDALRDMRLAGVSLL
ncbi:MAG: nicotinamidase/pyrazinamidase [Candidatus Binatia bacterium]|jgi:nicotinamidase/pyrazinamidase